MLVTLLIILTTVSILGFLVSNKKIFLLSSLWLILICFIVQYKQTLPTNLFQLTEMETVHQINRLHQYPQYTFRLGHILEERPESTLLFKLKKNFTDTFNFLLFPNIFITIIFIPFFIIGIFKSISTHPRFTLTLVVSSIILFTFIGHQNSNGPICLYPIIFSYSFFTFVQKKL